LALSESASPAATLKFNVQHQIDPLFPPNVRFWHLADMRQCAANVCF